MDTATSGQFRLRPAATADANAIVDVWSAGWREAHLGHVPDALLAHRSPQAFRERVPEILGTTTVAKVDHRVVGLVVTAGDEIEQLYVASGHRGTGIAAALLQHGETTIAVACRRAFLAVVTGNARARKFYERHGWHDAGSLDYHAWTTTGERIAVPCRRYETSLPPSTAPIECRVSEQPSGPHANSDRPSTPTSSTCSPTPCQSASEPSPSLSLSAQRCSPPPAGDAGLATQLR